MSALAERVQLLIQNFEEQEPEDVMQQSASPSGYLAQRHSFKVWHHKKKHLGVHTQLKGHLPAQECLLEVHYGFQEDLGQFGHSSKAAVENLGNDACEALR